MIGLALFAGVLLTCSPAAVAEDRDRVSFGDRIVVSEGETIGDAVCFFCSVESHGTIQGDVVSFFGGVRTDKPVHGDVVSFGGNVNLNDGASIDGDLVIFGGALRKSGDARTSQSVVIFPAIIFAIPLLILGAIIWGASALFRRRVPHYYIPPAR
jgi:acetyltransferase-like isoleucine patch superfamily enzyme